MGTVNGVPSEKEEVVLEGGMVSTPVFIRFTKTNGPRVVTVKTNT